MAVGQVECFVDVDQALDVVVPCRKLGESLCGITEGCAVDQRRSARGQPVNIYAESLLRLRELLADLKTRFVSIISRDQKQDVAVECRGIDFLGEGYLEAKAGCG